MPARDNVEIPKNIRPVRHGFINGSHGFDVMNWNVSTT